MTPHPRHIPDALLERYLTDSLDAAQRSRLEEALTHAPQERARLEALRADSAAFLIRNPPGPLVAKLQGQRRPWWRSRPALLVQGLAVVAVASLLFALQGEALLRLFHYRVLVRAVSGWVVRSWPGWEARSRWPTAPASGPPRARRGVGACTGVGRWSRSGPGR